MNEVLAAETYWECYHGFCSAAAKWLYGRHSQSRSQRALKLGKAFYAILWAYDRQMTLCLADGPFILTAPC